MAAIKKCTGMLSHFMAAQRVTNEQVSEKFDLLEKLFGDSMAGIGILKAVNTELSNHCAALELENVKLREMNW